MAKGSTEDYEQQVELFATKVAPGVRETVDGIALTSMAAGDG
ncbi:MAG: hypothetical protein AVDCRST_MAG25-119 [uncultured Rubrobacteraceae bacterium]|uniref:Uncharacterized protein n=1 Tax=uncultured Rubrobacteraceae bacterium TaxID=349277 RepID=A0A6J4QV76_9ACTN|nr:MAG: hypothetical protein AVDCRST_MAG25-119 [uncultured Rubrobacteraceae bacterium]